MKPTLLKFAFVFLLAAPGLAQQPATAAHATLADSQPSAGRIWADLMAGNKRFVAGMQRMRDTVGLRTGLAAAQHPNVIVLACSDSRVAPELVFDQNLGDLFVVRSAGNIADAIGVGSIEYAVEHLGSSVLVVLGHTKCGAVTAACSGEKMPTSNLQAIVDKISPAVETTRKAGAKDSAVVEAAIQENVHQSARDVVASSAVLQHFVEDGKLTVYEAVYQLDTGEVVQLNGGKAK